MNINAGDSLTVFYNKTVVLKTTVGYIIGKVANSVISNQAVNNLINNVLDASINTQRIVGIHVDVENFKTINDKRN